MYLGKQDSLFKLAKIICPFCKQISIGRKEEFIGTFESWINDIDEMMYCNPCDAAYYLPPGITFEGICPACGKQVETIDTKYLVLDFNKF